MRGSTFVLQATVSIFLLVQLGSAHQGKFHGTAETLNIEWCDAIGNCQTEAQYDLTTMWQCEDIPKKEGKQAYAHLSPNIKQEMIDFYVYDGWDCQGAGKQESFNTTKLQVEDKRSMKFRLRGNSEGKRDAQDDKMTIAYRIKELNQFHYVYEYEKETCEEVDEADLILLSGSKGTEYVRYYNTSDCTGLFSTLKTGDSNDDVVKIYDILPVSHASIKVYHGYL